MSLQLSVMKVPWQIIVVFFVLTLGIGASGYFYYDYLRISIKRDKQQDLEAIADLKVRQIAEWRKERLADARVVQLTPLIAGRISGIAAGVSGARTRQEVSTWMTALQSEYGYRDIYLLDPRGNVVVALKRREGPVDRQSREFALTALHSGDVAMSDLYRLPDGRITMGVAVPFRVPEAGVILPAGVLVMTLDPGDFLYPLVQSWPTPSQTSESLLVRQEGPDFLYLNELRHRKGTALTLRLPASGTRPPGAQGARGAATSGEIDYRGIPVVTAMRAVPGSAWLLVCKVDASEIYAPLRSQVLFVGALVALLITAAAMTAALIWRGRMTQEVRSLNAQLEQKVRERTAQLEAANSELEAFSSSVSHDLRSPLIVIRGFSRLLAGETAGRLSDRDREMLAAIQETAEKMEHLITDLLSFARSARQALVLSDVDMTGVAREALQEVLASSPGRPVEWRIGPLAPAQGDRSMLKQVFVNLLSNAEKFTRDTEHAVVEVGCRAERDETVYFVKDNGAGFDMADADRLFTVFERLHESESFAGTGVGLSIVRRIVHRHGGRVSAEGRVGRGAVFSFWLPGTAG